MNSPRLVLCYSYELGSANNVAVASGRSGLGQDAPVTSQATRKSSCHKALVPFLNIREMEFTQ